MAERNADLGRYELLDELGRGGMGVVYLARHVALGKLVAIKKLEIFGRRDDPLFAERFLREARMTSALSHPNVVTVHDFFEHEGAAYIAMEYAAGGSLRPRTGQMTLAQIAGVLEGVLAGLAHAARYGIVHRDLKPENLLISTDGGIQIADFGIAKAVGVTLIGSSLTVPGATVGTPQYMSPEQATDAAVGPQSDLYALGVVTYELLVGSTPFAETRAPLAVLMRHVHDPVPDPREIRPDVDPDLVDWTMWLLAKDASQRPKSPEHAWDELEPTIGRILGSRWRREAALLSPAEPSSGGKPLPPGAFDSRGDEAKLLEPSTPPGAPPEAEPQRRESYGTFESPPPPPRMPVIAKTPAITTPNDAIDRTHPDEEVLPPSQHLSDNESVHGVSFSPDPLAREHTILPPQGHTPQAKAPPLPIGDEVPPSNKWERLRLRQSRGPSLRVILSAALVPLALFLLARAVSSALESSVDPSSGSTGANVTDGTTLTIYSSLPLQGLTRGQSEAVINGEKLALNEVGSKVGKFKIEYVSLDDSTAQNPGTADEGKTAQNARQAVRDKSTIFYLGEFNSGGTKVSLPILNKAGIPQISPSNTYIGLTTDEPGSEPGEPDKYYPTGKRTYARVMPHDKVQGAALVSVMKEDGCKTATLWNDKSVYGAGLARNIKQSAEPGGLTIENEQGTDKNSPNYRAIASKVKSDCFVWAGVTGKNGVQVFKDVASANKTVKLYGPDGVTEEAFSNPKKGGIPAAVGARTKTTVATLGVKGFPAAAPVLRRYKQKYKTQTVDPYAIYGYEAMALALDALKRAGDKANDRDEVIKALFATKERQSVLGTYSIDANGDTSLTDYGVYVVKDGLPTYETKIIAATS